jgi:DNA-binding NtrC family response regulator
MTSPSLQCVLIVEDNDALRAAMAGMLRDRGAEVIEASTTAAAIASMRERIPDLVIADVCLPDGSALNVFEETQRLAPEPMKIGISGQASAEQAFELARVGVRAYLAKPFSLQQLRDEIERVRSEPPHIEPMVRAAVGLMPLREVTSRVRNAMIDEALARSQGSRSGAARLLEVSRQAIQQALAENPHAYRGRTSNAAGADETAATGETGEARTSRTFP